MQESSPQNRPERAPPDDGEADAFDLSLRRARRESAERAEATSAGRVGERARLEHLLAALDPILRRIPREADCFDVGVTHGFDRDGAPSRPRLFLDMIGYVECASGGGFRLAQSTRHGRVTVGEARDLAGAMLLVADYVARRLVEREEALAGDRTVENAARRLIARERAERSPSRAAETGEASPVAARPRSEPAARASLVLDDEPTGAPAAGKRFAAARARLARWRAGLRGSRGGAFERGFVFTIQFLGSALLTLIVALAAWWAWKSAGFVK